ncbi:MAG TPA: hypothetical protein VF615_04720 [Longimicrobiaceae bacterium]|jgi:hypothetical protein
MNSARRFPLRRVIAAGLLVVGGLSGCSDALLEPQATLPGARPVRSGSVYELPGIVVVGDPQESPPKDDNCIGGCDVMPPLIIGGGGSGTVHYGDGTSEYTDGSYEDGRKKIVQFVVCVVGKAGLSTLAIAPVVYWDIRNYYEAMMEYREAEYNYTYKSWYFPEQFSESEVDAAALQMQSAERKVNEARDRAASTLGAAAVVVGQAAKDCLKPTS